MSHDRDPLQMSSGEDDDFVSCDQCQIMFDKNDKSHILSQCLEMCHFFCPPCIQELLKTSSDTEKKLECPLCRLSETDKTNEQWCFACNVPASIGCYEEYHTVQKYCDLFNARSLQLKQQINQTNNACDQTLKHCQEIESSYKIILAWMQWLLGEINQWDSSNIATITHLKSLKEEFHVQQEKNLQFTMNNINQHIVQSKDRFQEVQVIKGKVSQLLHTYCNIKSQQYTSNLGSAELMTYFSTSLNQTNQSCINVLKFLMSFLDQGEKGMEELESDQVSNNIADKVVMRRTGEFLQKRRLEEDLESTMHLNKKARKENSDRSEAETNLSPDLLGSSGSSAEFKEAVELHLADINEKRAKLVRELEDTRDKLKISEERVIMQAKEAELNKDLPNRIARLEADLELNVKKVEQANREALNQMERAKAIQQKYEIESNQHAAVVEQLKTVCEQLVQSKSEVETTLRELANQNCEMEKLKLDKKVLEKRLQLEQMDVEKIKEARDKSTIQVVKTNAEFIKTQIKLQEEVRLAKEETAQFKTELAKNMDKHFNELHHLRNYKTQLEELEIKHEKLVHENERNCANLATLQAEKIKDQECVKIKDQEFIKIKDELEKAKQTIEMLNTNFHLPSTKQQQTASVLNQPRLLSTRNVTPTLSPQPIIRLNEMRNVPNAAVSLINNKPIKQFAIYNLNAIATDMLADLDNKKESDWSEFPCSNCKMSVEMGFYCGECQDFQLCILCHKKGEHQHKMEKFGFDLNRSNLLSNSKDLQADRKSRVDRRIISLVHSRNCSDAFCPESFCRTMKAVVAHNVVCHCKASSGALKRIPISQIRCVVCRQLVGLFICHAQHCTDLECYKPYCSNLKKKIDLSSTKNLPEFQKNESLPQTNLGNPNLKPLGPRIQNRVFLSAASSSNSKQDINQNQLQSTPPVVKIFPRAVNNVVTHSAPTLIGSVNSAIPSPAPAANTYEESLKRVQDHVALLIPAHKCQEGVNQANQSCSTPHCQKMKSLLKHVTGCQAGQPCEVPYCSQSKKIISHWSNCCLSDCTYCLGLHTSHVDSQSNVVGAPAPTVKPLSCVERAQSPAKPIDMPRLQRAPVYRLYPIDLMGKVRPATPPVIVSHANN